MLSSLRRELREKLAALWASLTVNLVMFENSEVFPNTVIGIKEHGKHGGLIIVNLNDQFNLMRTRLLIRALDSFFLQALIDRNVFDNKGYAFAELVMSVDSTDDQIRVTLPSDEVLYWSLRINRFVQ